MKIKVNEEWRQNRIRQQKLIKAAKEAFGIELGPSSSSKTFDACKFLVGKSPGNK